jgi:glycosyltransferase 2 family protein
MKQALINVLKQAHLWRGLITLLIAGFFGYRYGVSGHLIYIAFVLFLGGVGLLSLINRASTGWQNIGLNLGISLFFLDFVFGEINLSEMGEALVNANYGLLVLSMIMIGVHIVFRTIRCQWLLKPIADVPFWPAFRALLIGITGNTVLPAKAGEFLRAYVLGRSQSISKTAVFATVVVERIFDGLTVLLVLLVVIVLGIRDERLQLIGITGLVVFGGALVGLIIFMTKRHWADAIINKFLPHAMAERVLDLLNGFSSGLEVLKTPRLLAMVIFWNILTWTAIPFSFWFALLAFDFGSPLPWQAPLLMLPAMALGLAVPSAPGGVGLVQAAIKLTLDITFGAAATGATFEAAVAAASIMIHITQFAPEVIPGIFLFMYEGLSTSELKATGQMAGE